MAPKPVPPDAALTPCEPLLLYLSEDYRDVIAVAVKNHNLYFTCANKMNSAARFIKEVLDIPEDKS